MTALEAMKTRLKRATPGPWCYQHDGYIAFEFGTEETVLGKTFDAPNDQNDAEFIAHSREDMERLIAAVEVMRDAIQNIKSIRAEGFDPDCRGDEDCDHCHVDQIQNEAIAEADAILEGRK